MSNYQFPWWMQGITWPVMKTPTFTTHVQKALSGKESRIAYKQYPEFDFGMTITVARDDVIRTQYMASTEDLSQTSVWSTSNTLIIGAPYSINNLTPLNSLEADYILEAPQNATHYAWQMVSLTAGTYTYSMYAKSTTRFLILEMSDGGSNACTAGFNLTTGATVGTSTVGAFFSTVQAQVSPASVAGWYRCVLSFTTSTATSYLAVVGLSSTSNVSIPVYAGDGTSGVYIWGTQIESGLQLTGYMPNTLLTAPQIFSDRWALYGLYSALQGQYDTFLYEDPTFNSVLGQPYATGVSGTVSYQLQAQDFGNVAIASPGGQPSGYEISQALNGTPVIYQNKGDWQGVVQDATWTRTNYVIQSQALATSWSAGVNVTATNNAIAAPDGTVTATNLISTVTNGQHTVAQSAIAGLSSGGIYMLSGCFKPNGYNYVSLKISDAGSDSAYLTFNLSTGAVGVTTANAGTYGVLLALSGITSVSNGFFRCWVTVQCLTTAPTIATIAVCNADSAANYAGSGSAGIYGWGMQLEQVQNTVATAGLMPLAPTRYVPTTTIQLSVAADITTGTTGIVTFNVSPSTGDILTWNGCFFYRCRFNTDAQEFAEMYQSWWEVKKLEFQSVKI
jgi:hypothetical protein